MNINFNKTSTAASSPFDRALNGRGYGAANVSAAIPVAPLSQKTTQIAKNQMSMKPDQRNSARASNVVSGSENAHKVRKYTIGKMVQVGALSLVGVAAGLLVRHVAARQKMQAEMEKQICEIFEIEKQIKECENLLPAPIDCKQMVLNIYSETNQTLVRESYKSLLWREGVRTCQENLPNENCQTITQDILDQMQAGRSIQEASQHYISLLNQTAKTAEEGKSESIKENKKEDVSLEGKKENEASVTEGKKENEASVTEGKKENEASVTEGKKENEASLTEDKKENDVSLTEVKKEEPVIPNKNLEPPTKEDIKIHIRAEQAEREFEVKVGQPFAIELTSSLSSGHDSWEIVQLPSFLAQKEQLGGDTRSDQNEPGFVGQTSWDVFVVEAKEAGVGNISVKLPCKFDNSREETHTFVINATI